MLFRIAACAALLASATARNIVRQNSANTDTTITTTVTDGSTSTVTEETTLFKTVFSTIVITKTDIKTVTTTAKDVATATSVIYTTITQAAKRWIVAEPAPLAARTIPPPTLTADAAPGSQTTPASDYYGHPNVELLVRRGIIAKRATVTKTTTITSDVVTTIFNTHTSTVVSTTSSETTSVSTLTTTVFENAKTTVTVTSSIFLKTTTVTTGPAQTVESLPPDANIGTDAPTSTGSSSSPSGGSKKKSGLSTGAKAGIGAGAGVAGLALLGALGAFLYKRHKNKPKVMDDGTGAGMSEVPVGGIGGATRMSGAPTETVGSPRFTPSPVTSTIPTGSPVYNTSGPAELGGVAKKPDAEMGGDELPRFPEADGRPVMGHKSGPVDPVYEMPS